jgi:uncharacterized protein (DUF111 family)
LLQGFELVDDGLKGERITPTGAAILQHLHASQAADRTPRRLLRTGCGFGTKVFPGISNVLRVLAMENVAAAPAGDRVAQLAFEIDDQSPEDLAIALDRLRAHPGVLDVLQIPAFGKKGRMTAHIQVLAEPDQLDSVCERCFSETTTLGLRWQMIDRRILSRTSGTVDVGGRSVRVKTAQRPDVVTAKVESDDLLSIKGGRAERDRIRRAAEAATSDGEEQ